MDAAGPTSAAANAPPPITPIAIGKTSINVAHAGIRTPLVITICRLAKIPVTASNAIITFVGTAVPTTYVRAPNMTGKAVININGQYHQRIMIGSAAAR